MSTLLMNGFDTKISRLDLALFGHIKSQTTENDRRSLLALELAIRQKLNQFSYLEIGSHLGGSLQALVVDPCCTQIVSIDARPRFTPDERDLLVPYPENSTARMLRMLQQIPGANTKKIHTIDTSTDRITPDQVPIGPDYCFIDGEHTDVAVMRDARFCLSLLQPDGCIAFHDANIIYRGLDQFIQELVQAQREFRAYNLPDSVFVIEFGRLHLAELPHIQSLLDNNFKGYLWSLLANDQYRKVYKSRSVQTLLRVQRLVRKIVGKH